MILEADNISLSFGQKRILSGIYLKAETNKVTGILGRNGSGKTSLMRIIFGDLNPKYKNVRINGKYQKKALFKTNTVGYLPQHQMLPNSITIFYAFTLFQVSWNAFVAIFPSFETYKKTRFQHLSSGEQRIIETYLIVASDKKIIMLDEPFSFIAPLYVHKIKTIIQEQKKDKVILITDHYYQDILDISEVVYLLKEGYSKRIRTKSELEYEGYLSYS